MIDVLLVINDDGLQRIMKIKEMEGSINIYWLRSGKWDFHDDVSITTASSYIEKAKEVYDKV